MGDKILCPTFVSENLRGDRKSNFKHGLLLGVFQFSAPFRSIPKTSNSY